MEVIPKRKSSTRLWGDGVPRCENCGREPRAEDLFEIEERPEYGMATCLICYLVLRQFDADERGEESLEAAS